MMNRKRAGLADIRTRPKPKPKTADDEPEVPESENVTPHQEVPQPESSVSGPDSGSQSLPSKETGPSAAQAANDQTVGGSVAGLGPGPSSVRDTSEKSVLPEEGEKVVETFTFTSYEDKDPIEFEQKFVKLCESFIKDLNMRIQTNKLAPYSPSKKLTREPIDSEKSASQLIPPLEYFMGTPKDVRLAHFYSTGVAVGDVMLAKVVFKRADHFLFELICFDAAYGKNRYISDCGIKAACAVRNIPQRFTNKDVYDSYHEGDVFRAVVKSTKKDETDWICLTMHGKEARDLLPPHLKGISLGLIDMDMDRSIIPDYVKLSGGPAAMRSLGRGSISPSKRLKSSRVDDVLANESPYTSCLHSSAAFNNPDATLQNCERLRLPLSGVRDSFIPRLSLKYLPKQSMARAIKRVQCRQWAQETLAKGIEAMHNDNDCRAMGYFNQAIKIDPESVDAYVGRGACQANNHSYRIALEDFEIALKLDANHENAIKYFGKTSIQYARDFIAKRDYDRALRVLERGAQMDPTNEELKKLLTDIRYMVKKVTTIGGPAVPPPVSPVKRLPLPTARPSRSSNESLANLTLAETREKLSQLLESEKPAQPDKKVSAFGDTTKPELPPSLNTSGSFLSSSDAIPGLDDTPDESSASSSKRSQQRWGDVSIKRARSRSPVDRSTGSDRKRPDYGHDRGGGYDRHRQAHQQSYSDRKDYRGRGRGFGYGGGNRAGRPYDVFRDRYDRARGYGGGPSRDDGPSAIIKADKDREDGMLAMMMQAKACDPRNRTSSDNRTSSTDEMSEIERFAEEMRKRANTSM